MTKHTGKIEVIADRRRGAGGTLRATITLPGDANIKAGDTVTVEKVLTDEEIGRRLRAMLTPRKGTKEPSFALAPEQLRDLAESIEDEAGWPILADLIREVVESDT